MAKAPSSLSGDEVVLTRALRSGPRSRAELTDITGWSRNTVAAKLVRLADAGWVIEVEDGQASGQEGGRSERGRPFLRYGLNQAAALVFLARFDSDGTSGAICTLGGKVMAIEPHERRPEVGPESVVGEVGRMMEALSERAGIDRARIGAMIVGASGPVSGMGQTVPWSRVGVLPTDLAGRFGMPVAVENDANLMALGARHDHPEAGSLLVLLVQTGIGAGLILSGRLHRGLLGWAGEVGHIPVSAGGEAPCSCGNRGCVAGVAANPALMRAISTPERPVGSVAALRDLVRSGDTDAITTLRQAGRHIGEAIAGVVVGLAPEVILVGGHIAEIGDHVITGIRETLAQRTPPAISSQLLVAAAQDHDRVGIRGATDLAFDLMFPSPPWR